MSDAPVKIKANASPLDFRLSDSPLGDQSQHYGRIAVQPFRELRSAVSVERGEKWSRCSDCGLHGAERRPLGDVLIHKTPAGLKSPFNSWPRSR
jgi:hypothetical protein